MSHLKATVEEAHDQLSLVEEESHHNEAQDEALREEQETLGSLQKTLSDVKMKAREADRRLRSKEGELFMLEAEMEDQEQNAQALRDQCASISAENAKLRAQIREEGGNAHTAQTVFNTYRCKMERHRQVVLHAASQTDAHKELEKMKALVKSLTQEKEELQKDMKTTDGQHVQMAKEEIDALKEELVVMKDIVAEKREQLRKEYETQAQIKTDIEIQNKRYQAIVKHLHHQLRNARAAQRLMSGDV